MHRYKRLKGFIGLVCIAVLLLSTPMIPVAASDGKTVTATTSETIKQGSSGTCYVYIDSTESLAALDVTVYFDPAKVKIISLYNSVSNILYDSVKNTDNVQFNYILDGKGTASKTRLFYFYYQVLSDAEVGDAYFDITIGEAYDSALNDVTVLGSRTKFTIAETVTTKTCTVSASSTVSTAVEKEFSLNYRLSTYQIASGSAVIQYDPELFEVVSVASGEFLDNKTTDINTGLSGSVYLSFVGTEYNYKYDLVTVTFRVLKNVSETSTISFKATELCDKDLNDITCKDYATTANIVFDATYLGDAPKMNVTAAFDAQTQKVTAQILLEADSHLGAGDFTLGFDPEILTLSRYEKGFEPDFFNINDKEAEDGKLKFSIISLEDIVDAHTVLTVVFDATASCEGQSTALSIQGSLVADSMTNAIGLNLIGADVAVQGGHSYGDWIIDKEATTTEEGSKHKECSACGDTVTESIEKVPITSQIVRKGKTLEYKDLIYVKHVFDLVDIDLTAVDLSTDAGILCWTQEEYAQLSEIAYDPSHALVGLAPYPGSSHYFGKSEGIFTRYLADEYYYVGYVKLPDGAYIYSEPLLYGPQTYAYNMLGKATTSQKTRQLCVALLNYIAAAQKYFYPGIAESALANAGLTDEQKALDWSNAPENFNLAGAIPEEKMVQADTTVFTRSGKNLRFQEMISLLSVYQINSSVVANAEECGTIFWTAEQFAALNGAPGIDNIGSGKKIAMESYGSANMWCSVAPAVAAKDMADTSYYILGYVKHRDGTVSYSGVMSYSFEQYIYNKVTDSTTSAEMLEFAKRLYVYEREACNALK